MNLAAHRRGALAAVAALLLLAGGAHAQSGAVAGRVTDAARRPLPGAAVELLGTGLRAVTGPDGSYRLAPAPAGNARVAVRYLGFRGDTAAVAVPAGAAARADFTLAPDPIALEGLVVRGQRLGQALALNQQKTADNIRTVVSAEAIGRFPDPNSAEALQRLPGVSIQRDQGEGRYVLVRGTEARLNGVLIDGERVPAPEGEIRAVALDVIPADQLAAIEVSKTLTPDMDADAIGGAVNLVTRTPRRGQTVADLTLAGGYNELVGDRIQQVAGAWGRRFGAEERLGVLVGGSWYRTDRGSDNLEQEWGEEEFDGEDRTVLGNLEFRDYLVFRERYGATATVDYAWSDESRIHVRGLYNFFDDQEFRRRNRIRFDEGEFTSPTEVAGGVIERELKDRYESQEIWTAGVGGRHPLGRAQLDWSLSLAEANEKEPDRRDIVFVQEDLDLAYDASDPRRPSYTVSGGSEFDNGAFAFDELVVSNNLTRDRDRSAAVNLSLPVRLGAAPATVRVGGRIRAKEKMRRNDERVYDGFDGGDLLLADLAGSFEDRGFLGGRYRVGALPDPTRTRAFVAANLADFELDEDDTREATDPANYDADERVYAGYAMATVDVGRLRLVGGVRVEATDLEYRGNEVVLDEDGDYAGTTPVTGANDYVNVFPGLQARYRLGERTNLRAAVTTSIARPDYYALVPYRFANREDEEVALGNPSLEPTRSTNLDLLAEHYFENVGVVSGGVFYKRLTAYVYPRTFTVAGGQFDGFEAVQPQNGERAWLLGFEAAWEQSLAFLPGALGGLGVAANYTWTDSEARFPDRDGETSTLPGQARHVGNAALSYDRGGFSGRVAVNFHGKYVDQVGEEAAEDVYYDDHVQLDASASLRVHPRLRLFAELVNLTNEPLRYYQGTPDRPIVQEYYSWWSTFGLKVQL